MTSNVSPRDPLVSLERECDNLGNQLSALDKLDARVSVDVSEVLNQLDSIEGSARELAARVHLLKEEGVGDDQLAVPKILVSSLQERIENVRAKALNPMPNSHPSLRVAAAEGVPIRQPTGLPRGVDGALYRQKLPVAGDGNCMYRSVYASLMHEGKTDTLYRAVHAFRQRLLEQSEGERAHLFNRLELSGAEERLNLDRVDEVLEFLGSIRDGGESIHEMTSRVDRLFIQILRLLVYEKIQTTENIPFIEGDATVEGSREYYLLPARTMNCSAEQVHIGALSAALGVTVVMKASGHGDIFGAKNSSQKAHIYYEASESDGHYDALIPRRERGASTDSLELAAAGGGGRESVSPLSQHADQAAASSMTASARLEDSPSKVLSECQDLREEVFAFSNPARNSNGVEEDRSNLATLEESAKALEGRIRSMEEKGVKADELAEPQARMRSLYEEIERACSSIIERFYPPDDSAEVSSSESLPREADNRVRNILVVGILVALFSVAMRLYGRANAED